MTAALLWLAAAIGIGALWYTGHPATIDRGEGTRDAWDDHSWGHLGGSAVTALVFFLLTKDAALSFVASVSLWLLVEAAQWKPRDRQGGYFERWDAVWDVVGAGGVSAIAAALQRLQ